MLTRRRLLLGSGALLLGLVAPPLGAEWKGFEVEESCRRAEIIVVGTLARLRPSTAGEGEQMRDVVDAEIQVEDVLFGRGVSGALAFRWSNPHGLACPRIEHEGRAGTPWIWFLTRDARDPDVWHADHPNLARTLDERATVEAAIAKQLAPDRQTLEESKSIRMEIYAPGPRNPGAPPAPEPPPVVSAATRLAAAGPGARPVARALLGHASASARAWGCRLAHLLDDPALLPELLPLLDDATGVFVDEAARPGPLPLSEIARITIAGFAGVSGREFPIAEARAWAQEEIRRRAK